MLADDNAVEIVVFNGDGVLASLGEDAVHILKHHKRCLVEAADRSLTPRGRPIFRALRSDLLQVRAPQPVLERLAGSQG